MQLIMYILLHKKMSTSITHMFTSSKKSATNNGHVQFLQPFTECGY